MNWFKLFSFSTRISGKIKIQYQENSTIYGNKSNIPVNPVNPVNPVTDMSTFEDLPFDVVEKILRYIKYNFSPEEQAIVTLVSKTFSPLANKLVAPSLNWISNAYNYVKRCGVNKVSFNISFDTSKTSFFEIVRGSKRTKNIRNLPSEQERTARIFRQEGYNLYVSAEKQCDEKHKSELFAHMLICGGG